MIKTHVQIPDELYHSAKKVAERKEWSFAEVVRRGLEYMTTVNHVSDDSVEWALPLVKGMLPVSEKSLHAIMNEERDAISNI